MWNKDEVKGKFEQVKGQAKEAAGDAFDDEQLRNEGLEDQTAGAVQEGFGKIRRKAGEVVEEVGKQIKK